MGKYDYLWKVGAPPPPVRVHTLAKHRILREYIYTYIQVFAEQPHFRDLRLTLVDGFAGGGLYSHEITHEQMSGSPLILLEASKRAELDICENRVKQGGKPFKLLADYFFVESKKSNQDYLRSVLIEKGYGDALGRDIRLHEGTFADNVGQVIQFVEKKGRAGRCIFLLDQYGFSDVPFPLLRDIFRRLPHAEVLLTFAVDYLCDYLSDNAASRRMMENLGLGGDIDLSDFRDMQGARDRRYFIQSRLSPVLEKRSGAKFFTPFFIVSEKANREYWFIHLSTHARARDEMIKLHWRLNNHFRSNCGAGVDMLGYDPRKDTSLSGQQSFADFNFDADAENRTRAQLSMDIPRYLAQHRDGVTFEQLITEKIVTSPAHEDMTRKVLAPLLRDKEIEIIGPNGEKRREGLRTTKQDVVRISAQPLLFFFKGH